MNTARGRRMAKFGLMLMGLLVLALPGTAKAWWQKDWPYRKEIVIDAGPKAGALALPAGRTPVLVRLHSGNFSFEDSMDNGADLRFVGADDKTPLAYHIESFDPLLGVATVWVDVPEMPVGNAKSIWLYYGNKAAKPAVDTAATFDSDYVAIYHFDGAKGAPPKDKTAYGNTPTAAPPAYNEGSIIGQGARFTGAGPIIVAPSPSLAIPAGGAFSVSAWVKVDALAPRVAIVSRHDGAGAVIVGLENGTPFAETQGGATPSRVVSAQAVTLGQWVHLAFTVGAGKATLYVNGRPAGEAPGDMPALNGPIALGGDAQGAAAPFVGDMDEVRLSKIARAPGLILASALAEGPESKLVTYAADQKKAGVGFGLFGVIVKNVDHVSWAVIALLGVLGALSWWVIWSKISYANTLDRANDLFVEAFRTSGAEPLALARDGAASRQMQRSSIFRIYKAGADELARRVAAGRGRIDGLGADVIRALMDAKLVRENQSLSKSMVWLTIAISGGPFLGLLGTVLGVMLTFAAIAQAGEVNINAIAPGISAALLATVAGLAVAIPALFGYNYILLRNKNISANMITFTDEFVTRISESYSSSVAAE